MTALAVSIGAGRVVPAVAGGPQLAYTLDGILFAALGVFILMYARRRAREVDESATRGLYRRPADWVLAVVTGVAAFGGVVLGVLVAIGR